MTSKGLSWENCIGICTDGAKAMTGSRKGFIARVKQVSPNIVATHCVLHREALASKELCPDLNEVLISVVKIVNFIKTRPLNVRIFSALCAEVGADHHGLLLHSEVRWLSRGSVLRRVFELRNEIDQFLSDQDSNLATHFKDPAWNAKLAYVFDELNTLNTSMQGPQTNILDLSDKINGFTEKVRRWIERVRNGVTAMFPCYTELDDGERVDISDTICAHLTVLVDGFRKYFGK